MRKGLFNGKKRAGSNREVAIHLWKLYHSTTNSILSMAPFSKKFFYMWDREIGFQWFLPAYNLGDG